MRASWNGTVIAESDDVIEVEGNSYFPVADVDAGCLRPSNTRSHCSWKGEASYLTVVAGGQENADAAWYYPDPKPKAADLKGRVAFWKGVEVGE